MFNILFAFVLLVQVADPFAVQEKMLVKNQPALTDRDAAFKRFKTAVETGNADPIRAYSSYLEAETAAGTAWRSLEQELSRLRKAVGEKPDQRTKDRLAKLTAQVGAFMKHPADYNAVMKKYQERIKNSDFGPRPPDLPKPKQ